MIPAPYNPRVLDNPAKVKLRRGLAKFGLVETLVWNERTGHVVGGHQRLALLDEGHPGEDYELTVSVVNLDEVQERELNLLLNNLNAQGMFDEQLLADLLQTEGIDPEVAGFDQVDLQLILGDAGQGIFGGAAEDPEVKADAETIARMKQTKAAGKAQGKKADDPSFLLHLVFGSGEEAKRFLRALELPESDVYIDGRRLASAAGYDLDELP